MAMINEFKNQDNCSIRSFMMNQVAEEHSYCCRITGLSPKSGNMDVYLYSNEGETVILGIDPQDTPIDEEADETCFIGNSPQFYSGNNSRPSPVSMLIDVIYDYKQALRDNGIRVPEVWGVLLTVSRITNYDEMRYVWGIMGATVYQCLHGLYQPHIMVSDKFPMSIRKQNKAFWQWCDQRYGKNRFRAESLEEAIRNINATSDVYVDPSIYDELDEDELDIMDDDLTELQESHTEGITLSQNNIVKVEVLQPLSDPNSALNQLVGCKNIKEQISNLVELNRYNQRIQTVYPNWKGHHVSLHAIFFGRPGTGKTTVCKIYGALLKEAGVLSRGHVVVCNRGTFLGGNWGDEERALQQIVEMAKGGVLMIDEAYLLNSEHKSDPAKLIIPQLMDILANEQKRDIAIILCGYKEPMNKLLDTNPGLASRFPNRYEFQDFTIDELLEITRRRIREHSYRLTKTAWAKYKTLLSEAYAMRDPNTWGNARYVANLLERIYMIHAKRCMKQIPPISRFFTITPADIQPIDTPKPRPRIGF